VCSSDHSRDGAGRLIDIRDPLTGATFPGNKIPASRFNPLGQKILNFFPTPNWVDPGSEERRVGKEV